MSTFDKREDAYENKFAHDEELQFKAFAKAYKLLGLWAAEKLGKSGAAADDYAKGLVAEGVVKHDFEAAIIAQILKDFVGAGVGAVGTPDHAPFRGIPRSGAQRNQERLRLRRLRFS